MELDQPNARLQTGIPGRPVQPGERIVPLVLKLSLFGLLSIYLYQAAVTFIEYRRGEDWPFLLWIIRSSVFLFLHEGGHALFMFFGQTLHALGGSFWQIMFPFLSFLIGLRQRSQVVAPFALFWTGANMLDVSLYMRDAPLLQLPLLGGHASRHDWHFLFHQFDLIDSADLIADLTYYSGLLVCIGSIGAGVFLAVQRYRDPLRGLVTHAIKH